MAFKGWSPPSIGRTAAAARHTGSRCRTDLTSNVRARKKITLGEMRASGVRGLLAALSGPKGLPKTTRLPKTFSVRRCIRSTSSAPSDLRENRPFALSDTDDLEDCGECG